MIRTFTNTGSRITLNEDLLNDAMWASCNVRHDEQIPTMEKASEQAIKAVMAYLKIDPFEYDNISSQL